MRSPADGAAPALSIAVRGVPLPALGAAPGLDTLRAQAASRVGVLGADFPGTRFDVVVDEGDPVAPGGVLLRDRRHPDIAFTAAIGGTVSRVQRGARRSLQWIAIRGDDAPAADELKVPERPGPGDIRRLMLESGLWTAIRTRPYGYLPLPDASPDAVFVAALDTRPLAPDPAQVIARQPGWFAAGLDALAIMAQCTVYCCVAPGQPAPAATDSRVRPVTVSGGHPACLPGVSIHHLCPVGGGGRTAWEITCQDVMSLGRLLREGIPWRERVVSVGGPGVASPCLVEVAQGAAVADVVAGMTIDPAATLVTGAATHGRLAAGPGAFLGQRQFQITALPPGAGADDDTIAPLLPTTDLDRLSPPGILAAPMLRALLVGDAERARALGALELVEEDLAALSAASSAGADYGALLRIMLDRISREGG